MSKRLLFYVLLSWLFSVCAMAEERQVLTIHLTDGNNVEFLLPDQNPLVECSMGSMTVKFIEDVRKQTEEILSFTPSEVLNLTIDMVEYSGVKDVKSNEPRVRFDLTRGSVLHVSGLQEGDRLQVVALDGKNVQAPVKRIASEATVDLGQQPRGCYVVSVNKSFTFKLMKP